ncbi:hypothetical protein [Algibacter sp. R77976]|uniref:hypothetical protein n=1 Tax=Algibacter sp. R77976 TaxID=3093873 RepID=UPI0037C7B035
MQATSKIILWLTLCFLNYSCGQPSKDKAHLQANKTIELDGKIYTLKENVNLTKLQSSKKVEHKIIFHKLGDPQRNMAMCYLPLPSDWVLKNKPDSEGAQIFGPNDTKVFQTKINEFVYSQLPGYNQMSLEMGKQIKPLQSTEQITKQVLVPLAAKEGAKLTKQYKVPQLKAFDENYEQFVFKPLPMQKTFDALATEWVSKDNKRAIIIIRQYITYTQEACYWGYTLNMMETSDANFEIAKTRYFYALENTKFNPKWLQTRYMEDAQESARLGKLHQERMRGLIAEGEAIVRRGRAHSAMIDRKHKQFMDVHLERQTVSTGSTNYQVDAGSNVYWINGNGEYIPTDNVNFDPNLDPNLNNETWTKGNKVN